MEISYEELEVMLKDRYKFGLAENIDIHRPKIREHAAQEIESKVKDPTYEGKSGDFWIGMRTAAKIIREMNGA